MRILRSGYRAPGGRHAQREEREAEKMKAILARGLSKTYWFYKKEAGLAGSVRALFKAKKTYVEAVRKIDLDVDSGEVLGFIGPNGAGKTTTLKILSGILFPTDGDVKVMGFSPQRREKAFLKQITFLSGQRNQLYWDLPAEEYFNFCRVAYDIPEEVYQKRLSHLVELAGIGDLLNIPQRKLSFGQRKRCELVAGFLHDPKVIFLDEPTNALDIVNAKNIREFIRERGKHRDCTIIVTSHNMADIEQICERIVIINRGRLVYDGSIRNLLLTNGLGKQIRIVFNGPWQKNQIEKLGQIKEMNGHEVLIEVTANEAASVASCLFTNHPVKDISITEPTLEKIIESMYLRDNDGSKKIPPTPL